MNKHPIATTFVIAVVISLAAATMLPYSNQEAPWALGLIALAFPFVWFFAWLVTNALTWYQDAATPSPEDADETHPPPQ
jgi:hypothetical protein